LHFAQLELFFFLFPHTIVLFLFWYLFIRKDHFSGFYFVLISLISFFLLPFQIQLISNWLHLTLFWLLSLHFLTFSLKKSVQIIQNLRLLFSVKSLLSYTSYMRRILASSSAFHTFILASHYFWFSASIRAYSNLSILLNSPLLSLKFNKNYLVYSLCFLSFSLSKLSCIASLWITCLIISLSEANSLSSFAFLKAFYCLLFSYKS